ncbi:MAG: ABC transporter ATP-binding protein [Oxalobacter sp.]|nr:ABC transporter ATP-binding protein [Oxalobacter sp.]
MIEISNLSFSYGKNTPALEDISLSVKPGEIVNILGPNGSGKSTLLKIILGLLPVKTGRVCIDGKDIALMRHAELARMLSYVPQQHHGIFNYSVLDMVLMSRVSGASWFKYAQSDYDAAHDALKKVRIEKFAQRSYLELSGGERQLVLIARALAQGGTYFIMDEPVTGLDYGNQFYLLETIQSLSAASTKEKGMAFMLTTHHPEHALFLGGRAILMNEGRIIADGPVGEIVTPSEISSLYGLKPSLLQQIITTYGKYDGMAG